MYKRQPLREKLRFADVVINNEGQIEETAKQVKKVFQSLYPKVHEIQS